MAQSGQLKAKLKEEAAPYYGVMRDALRRSRLLLDKAKGDKGETSNDIMRAVVVLNHAYLEDFLRTLARIMMPFAPEMLSRVPLAGSSGRAEKFTLESLAKHRTKTVDSLIQESVSEHLDRSNFNNALQIVSFLEDLGVTLTSDDKLLLPTIDRMIQRRHLIVHRADRIKRGSEYQLQPIERDEVTGWVVATSDFMVGVLDPLIKEDPALKRAIRSLA